MGERERGGGRRDGRGTGSIVRHARQQWQARPCARAGVDAEEAAALGADQDRLGVGPCLLSFFCGFLVFLAILFVRQGTGGARPQPPRPRPLSQKPTAQKALSTCTQAAVRPSMHSSRLMARAGAQPRHIQRLCGWWVVVGGGSGVGEAVGSRRAQGEARENRGKAGPRSLTCPSGTRALAAPAARSWSLGLGRVAAATRFGRRRRSSAAAAPTFFCSFCCCRCGCRRVG